MFTDEQLRVAATIAGDIYADSLPDDCNHTFSKQFQRKMNQLIWHTNHPYTYRSLQCAACLFLALILAGSLILTFNFEARAAAWGWFIEQYESFYEHYFYKGTSDIPSNTSADRPKWIPDGYVEDAIIDMDGSYTVIYTNDAGQMLRFYYSAGAENADLFVETDGMTKKIIYINGNTAEIYLSGVEDVANNVMWVDAENEILYHISGFLSEYELVKIAENIIE